MTEVKNLNGKRICDAELTLRIMDFPAPELAAAMRQRDGFRQGAMMGAPGGLEGRIHAAPSISGWRMPPYW